MAHRPVAAVAGKQPLVKVRRTLRRLLTTWERAPRLVGLLVLALGLVDIISALTRAEDSRLQALRAYVPNVVVTASSALTLTAGLVLVLLSRGLRRRKRRAWLLTVTLLAVSIVTHLLKGLDGEEATLSLALLALLVLQRRAFVAEGDPRTRLRALAALVGLGLTGLVLSTAAIGLREDALAQPFDLTTSIASAGRAMVGLSGPVVWQDDRIGRHDAEQTRELSLALGLLTALSTLYLALRPSPPEGVSTEQDRVPMRDLLAKHGSRDSLGYFALRGDKSVVWSPTGKACITYRVVSGVMLASGDPLGDPEAWPTAQDAFLAIAERHAWIPAVMGCGEVAGRAWSRKGLSALELGDEAVVDVDTFSLDGRAMRNVRQAVSRVQRAGYSCTLSRVGDLSSDERDRVRSQAAAWRGAKVERGFSMALGRFGHEEDGDCVLVTARLDGELRALLHFVPWGPDGWSLDLMRRDRTADNGLNELMIAHALQQAAALGVRQVSLNFAMFRDALARGEQLGAGPLSRTWRWLLVFGGRWWQIESLYRFNAKFQPRWEPRFVCYPSAGDLPRVALATLEAESFLVRPRLRRRPVTVPALPELSTVGPQA